MEDLAPQQKARLQQVADGMLAIYNTLVRMRYLQSSWIQQGPHDMDHLLPFFHSLHLDPFIIYLYSILPYVDTGGVEDVDFLMGGEFADFRKKNHVKEARDPMHSDEDESKMRPWMTSLSRIGNHNCALLYDAKKHRIGIFGQMDSGSSDHNIHEGWTITQEVNGEQAVIQQGTSHESDEDSEEEDDQSEGESDGDEDEDEEEEDEEDECHWDEMDSRPAPNVLRDIVIWYENQTELPGVGERSSGIWQSENLKDLYTKNWWPTPLFDGDAFLVDLVRAHAVSSAKRDHEEPMMQIRALQGALVDKDHPRMRAMEERLSSASGPEEEWAVRWEIFLAQLVSSRSERRIAEIQSKMKEGPPEREDILLSEFKNLRGEFSRYEGQSKKTQEQINAVTASGGSEKVDRKLQLRHEWAGIQSRIYQRAFEACKADFEREFPGKTPTLDAVLENATRSGGFDYKARIDDLTASIKQSETEIPLVQQWIDQLPHDVVQARTTAEQMIENNRSHLVIAGQQRDTCIEALQLE